MLFWIWFFFSYWLLLDLSLFWKETTERLCVCLWIIIPQPSPKFFFLFFFWKSIIPNDNDVSTDETTFRWFPFRCNPQFPATDDRVFWMVVGWCRSVWVVGSQTTTTTTNEFVVEQSHNGCWMQEVVVLLLLGWQCSLERWNRRLPPPLVPQGDDVLPFVWYLVVAWAFGLSNFSFSFSFRNALWVSSASCAYQQHQHYTLELLQAWLEGL